MLARPKFQDGKWYTLAKLLAFEAELLHARQQNPEFSDAVRVDRSATEKWRRDEFLPFVNFAKHENLSPEATEFRKPLHETGADIEFKLNGKISRLQITMAYPAYWDENGVKLSGGYQNWLHMEKLTSEGALWGTGPYRRHRTGTISHRESCETSDDIHKSLVQGVVDAFEGKQARGQWDTILLVKAEDYTFKASLDADYFRAIIDEAALKVFPPGFERVVVVDYGPGFYWSSPTH